MKTKTTTILTSALLALSLLAGCVSTPTQGQKQLYGLDGLDAAKTVEEIKKSISFKTEWKIYNIDGMKILVGLTILPTYGESYINLHGYVYNRSFKEWRRFCLVKTRHVGWGEVYVDKSGVYLTAKANTKLKGKRVVQIDLGVLSDDSAYGDDDNYKLVPYEGKLDKGQAK